MNTSFGSLTRSLVGWPLLALLLFAAAPATVAEHDAGEPAGPLFSPAELQQMLAPIALYPDALLSQILMAATYPAEVAEAARWSEKNDQPEGEAAVEMVEQYDWDPSVTSLVAFPRILQMMDDKLDWTERIGDAFIAQRGDVMEAIQDLRRIARREGHLVSGEHIRVVPEDRVIIVEWRDPEVCYLPYYNPHVVYGHWRWSSHPPVYWDPWPGHHFEPEDSFGWGRGVGVGTSFFFGSLNWRDRNVYTNYVDPHRHRAGRVKVYNAHPRVWRHDHHHRRGAPYWNQAPAWRANREPDRDDRAPHHYRERGLGDQEFDRRNHDRNAHDGGGRGGYRSDREQRRSDDHDNHSGRGDDRKHDNERDPAGFAPPARGSRSARRDSGEPRVPRHQRNDSEQNHSQHNRGQQKPSAGSDRPGRFKASDRVATHADAQARAATSDADARPSPAGSRRSDPRVRGQGDSQNSRDERRTNFSR